MEEMIFYFDWKLFNILSLHDKIKRLCRNGRSRMINSFFNVSFLFCSSREKLERVGCWLLAGRNRLCINTNHEKNVLIAISNVP